MRSRQRRALVVLAAIAGLVWSVDAWGQSGAPGSARPGNATPETGAADLLDGMSPENLQELVRRAIQARLATERRQVAAEVRRGLLYDGDDIDKALALLARPMAGAKGGNVERICEALSIVDLRFGKMYKLFSAGKHAEAADVARRHLNTRQSTYLSAARHCVYARSLSAAGRNEDAVEAYRKILEIMPDRISFAAAAALNAARTYEKMSRFLYAAEMYQHWMRNYALTTDERRLTEISRKLREYHKIRQNPMGAVAEEMGQVQRRLAVVDSGPETRKRQGRIVALLEDLIKTIEEQQAGGKGQDGKKKSRKGQRQGSRGQDRISGRPGGTRPPTRGAQRSSVVPGQVRRPSDLASVRPTQESGDWANLPPREKQKIEAVRRKHLSERYKSIIGDYHTRMAESQGRE